MRLFLPVVACLLAGLGFSSAFQAPSCYSTSTVLKKRSPIVQECQGLQREQSCTGLTSALWSNIASDPDEKKKRPINPIRLVRKFFSTVWLLIQGSFRNFKIMTGKAKLKFLGLVLAVCLILDGIGSYAAKSHNNNVPRPKPPVEVHFSRFMDLIENSEKEGGKIINLRIADNQYTYKYIQPLTDAHKALLKDLSYGQPVTNTDIPCYDAFTRKVPVEPEFANYLRQHKVDFSSELLNSKILISAMVKIMFWGFYLYFMYLVIKVLSGPEDEPTAQLADTSQLTEATFNDIQGIDAAKVEVMELVDILKNPDKYSILGARAPTGLLLDGPPGTGKTLLARATAASAGVPLLYCTGSDFVEMFVGRGAARIRSTFERAQELAPCILFIDELDSLGMARSMDSNLGGNDESIQTLNQLLACMDGLDSSKQVCVLAATNRREVLDPALTRPGRFDRMVRLSLPDTAGREAILRVHAKKLPGFEECSGIDRKRSGSLGIGDKVDLSAVASITPGLSGAELAFIVNEAAIRAVRRVSAAIREGKDASQIVSSVGAEDFENSVANFFQTRRKGGMDNVIKNVFG